MPQFDEIDFDDIYFGKITIHGRVHEKMKLNLRVHRNMKEFMEK